VTYAGSDTLQPATAQVVVGSRAALTAPPAPQTVGRGSRFAVSGLLQPRHLAGTAAVTISCYRRESGVWVLHKTISAAIVDQANQPDASLYSATVSLPLAGKWRLRAYHADDAHAATWSAASTIVTVTARRTRPSGTATASPRCPERMASRRASRQLVVVTAARWAPETASCACSTTATATGWRRRRPSPPASGEGASSTASSATRDR